MREKFVIDPDRTKLRSEPAAIVRKVALVLALALTGVAGIHSLYPQGNAAADASRSGERLNPAPNTLAKVVPDVAADPVPVVVSTSSLHAPMAEAEQATGRSIPAGSSAAGRPQAPENQTQTSPEPPPGKVAEASPSPKQKVARHRSNRDSYAPYQYRDNRSWAWYSQRPAASPFFHF
jgi:hypothetical protein